MVTTESPADMLLPSPYLVELQKKFILGLKAFATEEKCNEPWPPRQSSRKYLRKKRSIILTLILTSRPASEFWSRPWLLFFRRLWHLVPETLRIWTYRHIMKLPKDSYLSHILSLPSLGLYAKINRVNEAAALKPLEEEAPDVPAPLLIDTFQPEGSRRGMLVITEVPGEQASHVWYRMKYPEREQFARDLGAILSQIRRIPNQTDRLFTGISMDRHSGAKLHD